MSAEPAAATTVTAPSVFESAVPDFAARMAASEGISTKREAIIRAALTMFADHGYQGTSLRRLAESVGIEAGSLYNHISSKNDLLSDMVVYATHEVLAGVRQQLESAPSDPVGRLLVAITAHIQFHCIQREQVIVLDRDFTALSGENAGKVAEAREAYEQVFREIVDEGVSSGAFRPHDAALSTKAILRLGPGTATWYRAKGPASAHEIGAFYADIFLRGLGADRAGPS